MTPDRTTHWIALLRAVNVGGRKVEMARLRELLGKQPGLTDVRTYIASGNVFFRSPAAGAGAESREELTQRLESCLEAEFGFRIPAVLRTEAEFAADIAAAPFHDRSPAEDERFSLLFTDGQLEAVVEVPKVSPKGDWEIVGVHGGTAYMVWHLKDGRPPANPGPSLEKSWGVQATGRFFHTCAKILTAAQKAH